MSWPKATKMGWPERSYVLLLFAPDLGLILFALTTQVFEDVAPDLGLSSFPSHVQVLVALAPVFGFISLPDNTQVFEELAPVACFSSFPSHFHDLDNDIELAMLNTYFLKTKELLFNAITFESIDKSFTHSTYLLAS